MSSILYSNVIIDRWSLSPLPSLCITTFAEVTQRHAPQSGVPTYYAVSNEVRDYILNVLLDWEKSVYSSGRVDSFLANGLKFSLISSWILRKVSLWGFQCKSGQWILAVYSDWNIPIMLTMIWSLGFYLKHHGLGTFFLIRESFSQLGFFPNI